MFFLIALNHPAHYHLFKNFRKEMINRGHKVVFSIKDKEVLSRLLDEESIDYIRMINRNDRKQDKAISIIKSNLVELIKGDFALYRFIKKNKPDFMIGTDVSISHIGLVTKVPSFVFNEDDLEINKLFCYSTYPFTKYIVSPSVCNTGRFKHKKIEYNGYQKLAYLHPNRFKADLSSLESSFTENKKNYIIRMVSFTAGHDIEHQHSGINSELLDKIIMRLKKHGQVHISSEKGVPEKYSQYKLDIKVNNIHNYIAAADMFISDSQSMTVEASMLGTPSLRFNSFSGRISVLNELEYKYKLTHSFNVDNESGFLEKLDELLETDNLRTVYLERRKQMLNDKIDLTAFLVWLFENFPESVKEIENNPEIQSKFK